MDPSRDDSSKILEIYPKNWKPPTDPPMAPMTANGINQYLRDLWIISLFV
jgi:hypothetical protein